VPGPLPDPNARRRNKRKPSTPLPLDGPLDKAPTCPYALGKAGKKWWKFAWKLPQATAWDDGAIYFVARRAQLEDDLAALDDGGDLAILFEELLGDAISEDDAKERQKILTSLGQTVGRLKALAGGRVSILKEMRELDNRLGLNPKAMADLRWTLEEPKEDADEEPDNKGGATVHRIRAVDAA
jgi:hypothetical protein